MKKSSLCKNNLGFFVLISYWWAKVSPKFFYLILLHLTIFDIFSAPLFDAYQENLQEKDSLILDYEKQFENINKKTKQIVADNKALTDKVNSLEDELGRLRQSYKKQVVERETAGIEKVTLVERAERAESKLKEVYELYEDKSK